MEQNIDTLEELKNIYADVSEWLKFAEAKHAATFAVWTALLIGLLSLEHFWTLKIIKQIFLIFPLFAGMLINLLAFMPFMNNSKFMKRICWEKYSKNPSDNIIFYRAVFVSAHKLETTNNKKNFNMMINKYERMLSAEFNNVRFTTFEKKYIRQIVDVATVTTIKIYLFNLEVKYIFWLLIIGCVAMIIA